MAAPGFKLKSETMTDRARPDEGLVSLLDELSLAQYVRPVTQSSAGSTASQAVSSFQPNDKSSAVPTGEPGPTVAVAVSHEKSTSAPARQTWQQMLALLAGAGAEVTVNPAPAVKPEPEVSSLPLNPWRWQWPEMLSVLAGQSGGQLTERKE